MTWFDHASLPSVMSADGRGPRAAVADLERVQQDGVTILRIRGKLVAENAATLKAEVSALEEAHASKVLVDLRELVYIDSSGIGALMSTFKRLDAAHVRIYFAGARDQPAYLLKVVRFEKTLALYDTIEEGMRRLNPP